MGRGNYCGVMSYRRFDCFKRRLWLDVAQWYRSAATSVGCLISSSIFRQQGPLMSHCRRKSSVTSARPTGCLISSSIFRKKSPSITHFHKKSLVMSGRPVGCLISFSNFLKKSSLISHFCKSAPSLLAHPSGASSYFPISAKRAL